MKTPLCQAALLMLLCAVALTTQAQTSGSVGIGTSTPDASAVLDLSATNKGLLVPRLDSVARVGIVAPATGLLVFQTSPRQGFYYYSGAGWRYLPDQTRSAGDNLGNGVATTAVNLQGNALVGRGDSLPAGVAGVGVRADGGLNIGQNTAGNNVFWGYRAGQANTTGNQNQFSGYQAGQANTTGSANQFSGYQSGLSNTVGYNNQFNGLRSGYSNTMGNINQFNGIESGYSNTIGSYNQFSGFQSGYYNTTGSQNLFIGYASGVNNRSGSDNQFSGFGSGYSNTVGSYNQFSGFESGYYNTTGSQNLFIGYQSGYRNTVGSRNQFSGYQSGIINTDGYENHFSGYQSGSNNTTGYENQFSGYRSGVNNTRGNQNLFVGRQAGQANTTGNNNWAFGYNAGPTTGNLTNAGAIGFNASVSQSNSLVLGGTGTNAVRVGIGTTAPAQSLEVAGTPAAQVVGTEGILRLTRPENVGVKYASTAEWRLGSYSTGGYNAFSRLDLRLGDGGSTPDRDVLTLLGSGRVGIGTTAPTQALEVVGQVFSSSGGFRFPDNTVQTTASGKYAQSVTLGGPGYATITHNLNSTDVLISVVDTSTGNVLPLTNSPTGFTELKIVDANTIRIGINLPGNTYRIVVLR